MASGSMNNPRFATNSGSLAAPAARETTARPAAQPVDYEQFFVSQLPIIDKVIGQVCRRHRLQESEREELASEVKLHLIDRDYEVLRRFEQRSSFATYLAVVVLRLFLNYRNRTWGRWRPSAEASRLGPTATLLERLIARDGWSFEEAQQQMRQNYGVDESRDALHALWLRLSPGGARRFVSEEAALDVPSPEPAPDANILNAEREFIEHRVRAALERARQAMTADERLLLRMRFDDGFTISEIAATLNLKPKPLYRTFERLLHGLRERMVADGVSGDQVHALLVEPLGPDAAEVARTGIVVPLTSDHAGERKRG
jgi:RNA polymerase sigma factor (sigma-70 family)